MYAHVHQKSGNDRRRVLDSDSDINENKNSDDDSDETDECHRDATLCKTGCESEGDYNDQASSPCSDNVSHSDDDGDNQSMRNSDDDVTESESVVNDEPTDDVVVATRHDEEEEERRSGDGEEQARDSDSELDIDEDKWNPAYVPRSGDYYQHDMRLEDDAPSSKKGNKCPRIRKSLPDVVSRWKHDKYEESSQRPKSVGEIVSIYGYNIRKCSSEIFQRPMHRRKPGTYQRGTLSDYFPNNRSRDNGERRTGVTTQLKVPCRYAGKDKDPNVRSSSRCSYEDKADDKLSVEDGGTSELYHSVTKLSKRNKKNARILYKHEPNARSRHQKVPKFSRHNRSDARFYYNYEAKKSGRGEHCSRLPHRDEHDRMFFKMCQPGSRKPFDSREPPGKTLVSEKKIPYQSREAHEASLNTENNEQLAGGSSRNYNKYSRTEGSKPTNCKEFKYDTVDLDSAEREKTGYLKDVKKPNRSRKNDSQTQTENFGMDANSLNNARSRGRRDVIRSTDALTNSKHSRENNKSSQDGSKNNRRSGPDREMEHEKEILYTGKRNVSVSESSQQSAMAMSWPANVLLKRNLEKNAENRSQSVQSDDSRRFSRDKDANVLEDLEYRKMHFGDNKLPRPDNIDVSPVVRETRSYNKARTGGQTAYVPANRNSKFVNSRYDTRSNQRERIDNCFLGERGGDGFEGRSANDKIVATRCEAKVGSREQQRAGIKSIEKSYICCTYTSRENKQDTRLLSDISKHKHVTKGQYTYSTNYLDNLKNAMSDVTLSESEPRCSGLDIMAKREYKNEGDVDFRGSPQGTIGFAKEKPNYIDQIKELNVKDFDLRSAGSGEWDSRLSNKKVDTMMTGDSQDIKMRQLDQHERGAKLLIDQRVDTWDRSESYNKLSLHENKPGVDQRSVCSTINLFRNQFIREQNSGVRGYETQSSHEVFHRSRFESDKRYANLGRNKPERRLNVDEDERLNRSNVSKHGSRNEDVYKDRSVSGNEDDERKSKFDRDEPFRRIPRHNAGYGSDSEYQCGDDKFRHVFRDSRFSRKDNQPQINKHDSRKPDSRLNRGGYNARPHREEYVRSNTDTHRTNYKMYRDYQQDTEWENFEHRNRFVTNKHVITNKQDTRLRCGRNDDRFYAPDDEDKMEEFRRGHFEPGSGWLVQLKNCKKNEIEDSKENFEKECVDKILPGTGISNADIQHLDDILLSGEDLENVNYDTDDRDSNRWYRMTLEEEREEEKMSCSKTLPMEKDKFEKSGDFVHESHNTGMIHKSRDQKKDEIERKSGETKKIEKENSEKYNMREMSSVGCSPKHVRNKEKRERIATRVFQNSRFAVDDSQLLSRKFADEVGYSTDLRYPENECVSQKKIRQHSFDDSRNTDCSDLDFSDEKRKPSDSVSIEENEALPERSSISHDVSSNVTSDLTADRKPKRYSTQRFRTNEKEVAANLRTSSPQTMSDTNVRTVPSLCALNYTEPFFDVQPSLHHFRAPFPPIVPAINRYSYPRHVLNPPSHYRLPRNPLRVPIPDNASHYWGTYSGIPGQNASPAYMYPQLRQSSNFMQESGQRNAVYYSGLLPCQPRLLHPNTCRPHAIPIVVPEDKLEADEMKVNPKSEFDEFHK